MRALRSPRLLVAAVAAAICLAGIERTISIVLRHAPGSVTTAFTLGAALLGAWAIAVLREE